MTPVVAIARCNSLLRSAALSERLNGLVRQIIGDPELKKKFADLGYFTTGSAPEACFEKLKSETERWTKVAREKTSRSRADTVLLRLPASSC